MVCSIDQLLLESQRPFNSKHVDTSFEQTGQNVNEVSHVTFVMQMTPPPKKKKKLQQAEIIRYSLSSK